MPLALALCQISSINLLLAALYFIGGVRVTFSTGIVAGGNLAYWYVQADDRETPLTAEGRVTSLPWCSPTSPLL